MLRKLGGRFEKGSLRILIGLFRDLCASVRWMNVVVEGRSWWSDFEFGAFGFGRTGCRRLGMKGFEGMDADATEGASLYIPNSEPSIDLYSKVPSPAITCRLDVAYVWHWPSMNRDRLRT
jgi:hypothetical protein